MGRPTASRATAARLDDVIPLTSFHDAKKQDLAPPDRNTAGRPAHRRARRLKSRDHRPRRTNCEPWSATFVFRNCMSKFNSKDSRRRTRRSGTEWQLEYATGRTERLALTAQTAPITAHCIGLDERAPDTPIKLIPDRPNSAAESRFSRKTPRN
jgi:hypothetical protein